MKRMEATSSDRDPRRVARADTESSTAPAMAGAAKAAGPAAAAGSDLHIGADGTVTIDPEASHQDEQQIAQRMRATGRWLILPIVSQDFAENLRQLAIAYNDPTQRLAMVQSFGCVSDMVAAQAGAQPTAEPAGTAPQYDGLPEAGTAAAAAVDTYEVETHNAHADSAVLLQQSGTLTVLLALDQIFAQGTKTVGQATAPLARQIAGTVSDVCAAVQKELPRNPGLQRTLGPALSYTSVRVAKGQQTKKKIKAVRAKDAKAAGAKAAGPAAQGTPAGVQGGTAGNMK